MPFLDNSRHLARVWWANARSGIIREMEFRTNFFLGLVKQALWFCTYLFFIDIIFQNTPRLAGWTQAEALIIFALSRLIEGLMNTLFIHNIMDFPRLIQRGEFDFFLVKPVPAQLLMAFKNFHFQNIGNVIAGIGLLVYAIPRLEQSPNLTSWLLFMVLAALGIIVFYALLILVASLVFYSDRLEALWGFVILFSEPLTVPFDIFPRVPRAALTYVVPVAFVVFVPAQILTGRLAWWQVPIALIIAIIFVTLANLAWRSGLRRYSSASS